MVVRLFLFLTVLARSVAGSVPSAVTVSVRADSTVLIIGRWLNLQLEVSAPPDVQLAWPAIGDSLGGMEVLSRTPVDTLKQGNIIKYSQRLTLTAFEPGSYFIPPFQVAYKGTLQAVPDTAGSDSVAVRFNTIEVDTTKAIRDISPPLDEPFTWREIYSYLLWGGILLLVLTAVTVWLLRRKKKPVVFSFIPSEPALSPYETAARALQALEKEKLWQRGEVKQYYTRLTDIIRIYLETGMNIPAMESTTPEILRALDRPDKSAFALLEYLLHTADMVKFAKSQPLPSDHDRCMKAAYDFLAIIHAKDKSDIKDNEFTSLAKEGHEVVG